MGSTLITEEAAKLTLYRVQSYLKAIRSFDFKEAFPNYAQNAYDWRVDKYEPQR
jgi:hypothetical protein